jgi:glycosyltransferase involved in cell wall biosynthesis
MDVLRVLHLSSGNLFGGVERVIGSLADHRSLCPSMAPAFALAFDGRQARELRAAGSPVGILGGPRLRNPLSVRAARHALDRLLDERPADVVICHNPWALVVYGPPVQRRGVPLVLWVHGAVTGSTLIERLAKRIRPTAVVANSQFTASGVDRLHPGVPRDVAYAPLARAPRPRPDRRDAVRRDLATPPEATVIATVSRIESGKGHALLLQALAAIPARLPWTSWIIGGAQRPSEYALARRLEAMAARLGIADRVRWLGERSDVPDLLAGADIYCQANTAPDAFGMSFVEALGAGLPVVTTALGGAIEIVDESCGILTAPGDRQALASALESLIVDATRRKSLANAGPSRARALCDPALRLRELHEILLRVTGRPAERLSGVEA